MKDTKTPESITETFKATFNFFQNQRKPDGYEEFLQRLAGHCLNYGLEDIDCITKLMNYAVKLSVYCPILNFPQAEWKDLHEFQLKKIQFRKDLATLASIFKEGERIKIQASMPNGDCKKKHITLDIETQSLLQKMAFFSLNSLLTKEGFGYEMHGITGKKEDLDSDTYDFMIGHNFKEPYTDKELADIIEFESRKLSDEKTMRGRSDAEIPRLGSIVHGFIEAGGDGLASLTTFQRYCLVGDLMLEAGVSPVEQVEWEEILTNKDKADKVKHWEESYWKIIGK